MDPSARSLLPRTTISSAASSSPLSSSMIVAIVLITFFVLIFFGLTGRFIYVHVFCRSGPSTSQVHARDANTVDIEASYAKSSSADAADSPSLRLAERSPATGWLTGLWAQPAESELPWPVLAAVPSLRPRRSRMFRLLRFWKKEKHEPFTVADVLKAIEDVQAREEAALAAADEDATRPRKIGAWESFLTLCGLSPKSFNVPGIIVHPCDGSPAYNYDERKSVAPTHAAQMRIHSPPTSLTAAGSAFCSPTVSEPDSPPLATPTLFSRVLPPTALASDIAKPPPSASSTASAKLNAYMDNAPHGVVEQVGLGLH